MTIRDFPFRTPALSWTRFPSAGPSVGFFLAMTLFLGACDSNGPKTPTLEGTWSGTIAEPDVDVNMFLLEEDQNTVTGSAQVIFPSTGAGDGQVNGTRNGTSVTLTIEIDEVMAGGSIVLNGELEGDDTLTCTASSGLLGGEFPVVFQRTGS
jgi:hypothetical protein